VLRSKVVCDQCGTLLAGGHKSLPRFSKWGRGNFCFFNFGQYFWSRCLLSFEVSLTFDCASDDHDNHDADARSSGAAT
jgi:hypothetical protein